MRKTILCLSLFICNALAAQSSQMIANGVETYAVLSVDCLQGSTVASGIYVEPKRILTVSHIIPSQDSCRIEAEGVPAKILKQSADADLMLLATTGKHKWAVMADDVRLYEPVFMVGTPYGILAIVTFGRVVGVNPKELLIDAHIAQGFSGGGVFNSRGQLVGVASGKLEPFAIAVALSSIKEFLR